VKKLIDYRWKRWIWPRCFYSWQDLRTKYKLFFKVYNGGQCAMVLIKNVPTTSKGYWYLKTQQRTILTNVVNETIWVCLLKLHNKLSITQHELNFLFYHFIQKHFELFFQIQWKKLNGAKWSSISHLDFKNNENVKIIKYIFKIILLLLLYNY
jgi:hypothetical protein